MPLHKFWDLFNINSFKTECLSNEMDKCWSQNSHKYTSIYQWNTFNSCKRNIFVYVLEIDWFIWNSLNNSMCSILNAFASVFNSLFHTYTHKHSEDLKFNMLVLCQFMFDSITLFTLHFWMRWFCWVFFRGNDCLPFDCFDIEFFFFQWLSLIIVNWLLMLFIVSFLRTFDW